jgi:hypothetical protein
LINFIPPSKVIEVKRFIFEVAEANFVFHLVFMGFHLEFSLFWVSMKIQPLTSFGLNGLKNSISLRGSEVDPNIPSRLCVWTKRRELDFST